MAWAFSHSLYSTFSSWNHDEVIAWNRFPYNHPFPREKVARFVEWITVSEWVDGWLSEGRRGEGAGSGRVNFMRSFCAVAQLTEIHCVSMLSPNPHTSFTTGLSNKTLDWIYILQRPPGTFLITMSAVSSNHQKRIAGHSPVSFYCL